MQYKSKTKTKVTHIRDNINIIFLSYFSPVALEPNFGPLPPP
jgi:hypothetical protein